MMLGPRSGGRNFRRFFIFPLSSIPLQSNCTSLDAFGSLRVVICASQPAPRSFLLRSPNLVVYCAIDSLISPSAQPAPGFDDFLAALTEATIPCVWVTRRNRHQLDTAIRMLGQGVPFIAESNSRVTVFDELARAKGIAKSFYWSTSAPKKAPQRKPMCRTGQKSPPH